MKSLVKTFVVLVVIALLTAGGCRERQTTETAQETATTAREQVETAPAAEEGGTDIGDTMPAYEAKWLDGSTFDLAKSRGKVVLLNVWATWCGPCRYEIPELQAIHDEHAPKGFEVIGVSVDQSGADAVKQFVDERKMTYPVALDEEGRIATLLETTVLPTTVLLDREGKIVWKRYGAIMPGDQDLAKAIESTL